MSMRKPLKSAVQRIRSLIHEARNECSEPNSQPAITRRIITFKRFLGEIETDRGMLMHLLARGLEQEVRFVLKKTNDESDHHGCTDQQIEMWPETLRQLVKDINRARVFVPSLGEFIELEPEALTRDQINEAGAYLIGKGHDCIRVGNALVTLSRAI